MEKINIKKFLKDESAATSIEYALLACLISLAILLPLGKINKRLYKIFRKIGHILKEALE